MNTVCSFIDKPVLEISCCSSFLLPPFPFHKPKVKAEPNLHIFVALVTLFWPIMPANPTNLLSLRVGLSQKCLQRVELPFTNYFGAGNIILIFCDSYYFSVSSNTYTNPCFIHSDVSPQMWQRRLRYIRWMFAKFVFSFALLGDLQQAKCYSAPCH